MKAKHTPGPWSAFISPNQKTIAIDIGATPKGLRPNIVDWMGFDGNGIPLNQNVANARLIASAPELLEALKALVKMHSNYFGIDGAWDEEFNKANKAIAKAEGA
jgi:hypothetical protein